MTTTYLGTKFGYGGSSEKERYDIRKDEGTWGREWYATSAAGWHCPVLFTPYTWKAFIQDLPIIAAYLAKSAWYRITH